MKWEDDLTLELERGAKKKQRQKKKRRAIKKRKLKEDIRKLEILLKIELEKIDELDSFQNKPISISSEEYPESSSEDGVDSKQLVPSDDEEYKPPTRSKRKK